MKVAVYPGSFDPITFGHLDTVRAMHSVADDTSGRMAAAFCSGDSIEPASAPDGAPCSIDTGTTNDAAINVARSMIPFPRRDALYARRRPSQRRKRT